MFDPLLTPAACLHAFALMGLLAFMCRRWALPRKEWPFFILLLLWATLVLTGHVAGLGNNLGHLYAYVPLSFASLGFIVLFFGGFARLAPTAPLLAAPKLSFGPIDSARARKIIFWFLVVTLGLFALISLVLGMSVYPDNADSMIYRLPRAFWYASHGSFLHPFESMDKRLVFYPLDGVALYVPLVLYGLPGTFHSIPSLLSWAVIVYATYRFARELGSNKLIALFAAWLVGMTPSILAQATSTNDEILAAGALLCCLYMGWRWLVTGKRLYFLMAGLGVGLSAGTKLHIVFLMPMIGILVLVALWHAYKNKTLWGKWGRAIGWPTALATLATVAVMFLPFLFYNYASSGRFYFLNDFKGDVFNLGASLRGGGQNLLIYLSQMILSPIADLNMWPVANDRQIFNSALNEMFSPFIDSLLLKDQSFYHMAYRFVGITLPVSVRFVEFSLWSAFVWLLWPWQGALAWRQKFPLRSVFFILAMTPPLWLFFWSFSTLYMEGTATYFTFYLVCAAPVAVMVFAPIRRELYNDLRWVTVALVVLTNLIVCTNLVMFSGFRALPDLVYAKTWPYDWLLSDQKVIDEIRAAKRIRIAFTHEKMPYFGYMHWNPRAEYLTPFAIRKESDFPDYENALQILPISGLYIYGYMPLKIPGKKTKGVTYLGAVRAIGREAIFASGVGVEKRHPAESNYLILGAEMRYDKNGEWVVRFGEDPAGFSPDDQLTFEYDLKKDGQSLYHRPASKNPFFTIRLGRNPHENQLALTIIVRSAWSGKELTRATYPMGGPGSWLPEGPEY